jgi:hypothetical protein
VPAQERLREDPSAPGNNQAIALSPLAVQPPTILQAGGLQPQPTFTPSAITPNVVSPIQLTQAPAPPPGPPTLPPPATAGGGPAVPRPPPGPPPTPAVGTPRNVTIRPRQSINGQIMSRKLENGETAIVYTGGVIISAGSLADKKGLIDIEGDRVVLWTKDNTEDTGKKMSGAQGATTNAAEFYISGHVEMRYLGTKGQTETLRADEVYYDLGRSVAIALRADLEVRDPKLRYPGHLQADELVQLNAKKFQTNHSETFSTILPSDPGLKIELRESTLVESERIRKSIFGQTYIDPKTGEPEIVSDRTFSGKDLVVRLEGVPIWYFPYYSGTLARPLGPLDGFSFNYNRIFGFQTFTTWDMYELLGMKKGEGERWKLYLDFMTARGPALGNEYDYSGTTLFGLTGKFDNITKAYGIMDHGHDIIGSGGDFNYLNATTLVPIVHPQFRGRFFEQLNAQQMEEGFSFQGQLSLISDRNFMEQFYFTEHTNGLNQESFAYLKQQKDNWAWTVLGEPRLRDWITETAWLPKVDGYLLGQTLFDRFIYSAKVDVGYAQLRTTGQAPPAFDPTDVKVNTGRADAYQELALPFNAGAFKLMPYIIGDLTYYTEDINADNVGRLYGGGGLRASIPLSRLFPEVKSELFNLDGLYHKIVLSGNYFSAWSTVPFSHLPQLDRLNDDVTDFTLREMHILQPVFNPATGTNLTTSPVFDPQMYAIRRLLDNRIDTRDSIEVLQLDLNQRLQTKRGFPGSEHVVGWMTLDVQGSLFPDTHRDNFGHYFGVLQYDWNWNIGDRTALFSSGWAEPMQGGPRVFAVGATFNRPDTTNLTLSYRQLDPVGSRAVIASITYPFSAKYALTASTVWDFGAKVESSNILITRKGTDVLVGAGFTYSSVLNTVGFQFEIIPNLLLSAIRPGGTGLQGQGMGNTATGR